MDLSSLSGLTGYIRYDSADMVVASIVFLLMFLGAIGILFAFFSWCISGSKSNQYRKLLVDMFVVGMIHKYAKEEGLDLVKELQEFARIEKKAKLSMKGLDEVIENELKEKISKTVDEKTDEKTK